MSEDLEALEDDAVGRVPAMAHESVVKAPELLTPEDRATDTHLALEARSRWRRAHAGMARLMCPLCGAEVPDDHRARVQHRDWHKDLERVRAAVGLPPGHVSLTVDYAGVAERARRHTGAAVAVCFALMLITAVVIVVSTL